MREGILRIFARDLRQASRHQADAYTWARAWRLKFDFHRHQRAGGYRDLFHDEDYIKAFLQILGADDYPRQREYAPKLRDAVDAHCPVLDLFANATPVSASVRKG